MKNKRIIKFTAMLLSVLLLFSSLSLSTFADESNEEIYESDYVMSCAPPVWVVPIIIALAPFMFCVEMFQSFMKGDFSILTEIPDLFVSVWTSVFG